MSIEAVALAIDVVPQPLSQANARLSLELGSEREKAPKDLVVKEVARASQALPVEEGLVLPRLQIRL